MEDNKYKRGFFLSKLDIFNIIDGCTQIEPNKLEHFNMFYQKTCKRFKFYTGTKWESHIEEAGVIRLIGMLQSYFLDTYENYLICHLHKDSLISASLPIDRSKLREYLVILVKDAILLDLIQLSILNIQNIFF